MSLPFANPSGRMMRGVVACYISLPHACRPFRESLPSALACRKSFPKRFGLCVLRVRLVTGGCCAGAAQRPSSSQQDRRVEGHLRIISWRLPRLIRAEQSSVKPSPLPPLPCACICREPYGRPVTFGRSRLLAGRPLCIDTTCQTPS